jgi:hypothetical protein
MDTKRILISLSLGFVILAFVSASWAGETRIPLEALPNHIQMPVEPEREPRPTCSRPTPEDMEHMLPLCRNLHLENGK